MSTTPCVIEAWTPADPRWNELAAVIAAEEQTDWAFEPFFEAFPRHFLVALQDRKIAGFLMFVVWPIGPYDRGHPPLQLNGVVLTEAKIIAFGVRTEFRRQGIGRMLQEETLRRAKALGCYQVRSVNSADHPENQQLKLSMGFGVEPMERDAPSLAFVMPLR